MAWTLYRVPVGRRSEIEAVLKDDLLARQSQKLRDAASIGGPAGELYVLLEGSEAAVQRAQEMLGPIGVRLAGTEAQELYRRFKDEEESASAGMGLFFTD